MKSTSKAHQIPLLYRQFDIFGRCLVGSKDVDPVYLWIKAFLKNKKHIDREWFALIYVLFYSLESAINFTKDFPEPSTFKPSLFLSKREKGLLSKFGHERRGNVRNPVIQLEIIEHLRGMATELAFPVDYTRSNLSFRNHILSLPHHGLWAAFKLAEVFEKSLGYESLKILDLGLTGRNPNSNDGPVGGLRSLFGKDIRYDKEWFGIWDRFGVNLAKSYGMDLGEIETVFCKWHKISSGKYYVGHDIEELNELRSVLGDEEHEKIMLEAGFDSRFFSQEIIGVRKPLKKVFKDKGEFINEDFKGLYPEVDIVREILKL